MREGLLPIWRDPPTCTAFSKASPSVVVVLRLLICTWPTKNAHPTRYGFSAAKKLKQTTFGYSIWIKSALSDNDHTATAAAAVAVAITMVAMQPTRSTEIVRGSESEGR